MLWLVLLFGLLIGGLGLWGVVAPHSLLAWVGHWQSRKLLWLAAALRLGFGAALWLAADASRSPLFFRILGSLSLLSGLALPVMGPGRFAAVIAWWTRRPAPVARAWCGVAVALGLAVVAAALPGLG